MLECPAFERHERFPGQSGRGIVLSVFFSRQDIGDRVTLTVLHSGKEIEVPVALVARTEGPEQS